MPDIEDELLALAGGNESSDEEEMMSDRGSREDSASPPPAKKSSKDGSRKAPAKRGKKHAGDDSEEEGEASSVPGSPNSIGSAAMDESDSEAENDDRGDADEDEKYPVDGMFTSLAEKAQIMSLREVERESILAERSTEIERQRQNRMLRQLVSKQENEEKKAMKIRKRTAASADLEDDDRKSSRQRTETKTGAAIDTLRRARAEKNDRARAREENRRVDRHSPRRDRRGSSVASSRSRDSYDDRARSASPKAADRELPPPGIRDFERIRVGRSRFAQYCFNPGFDDALSGCYVRVSLGPDPSGVDQYRMAKIKNFTTGKPYAMTGPGGSFVTDQYVNVLHGKSPKEFAFIFCSDRPFTEREFNRYVTVMHNEGLALPKTQHLLNKIDDINKFVSRSLTNDEIGEKVERKRNLRYKFDPERRERLLRELEEAKMAGKTARAADIQDELDDMQSNRLAFRTTLSPQKGSSVSTAQQDRLADINRERRRQNAANVGKAQLKEKAEARRRELAMERGETTEIDMSRRIRTKTKFVHDAKKQEQEMASTLSQNGTPKLGPQKKESEVLPHIARAMENARKAEKKGMATIHRPICDDDIIGNIELDIDIDID